MRRAPLAILAIAVALAGCGEDEGNSKGSVTAQAGKPIPVSGFEYGFEPGTITVRGGAGGGASKPVPVTFELKNDGSLPHDIHVRKDDSDLGGTEAVGDGDEASATVELEPGEYEFICSVGDHAELGMKGTLEVR